MQCFSVISVHICTCGLPFWNQCVQIHFQLTDVLRSTQVCMGIDSVWRHSPLVSGGKDRTLREITQRWMQESGWWRGRKGTWNTQTVGGVGLCFGYFDSAARMILTFYLPLSARLSRKLSAFWCWHNKHQRALRDPGRWHWALTQRSPNISIIMLPTFESLKEWDLATCLFIMNIYQTKQAQSVPFVWGSRNLFKPTIIFQLL